MESAILFAWATCDQKQVRKVVRIENRNLHVMDNKTHLFHHQFARFVRPRTRGKTFTTGSYLFAQPGCSGTRARLVPSVLMVVVFVLCAFVCLFRSNDFAIHDLQITNWSRQTKRLVVKPRRFGKFGQSHPSHFESNLIAWHNDKHMLPPSLTTISPVPPDS